MAEGHSEKALLLVSYNLSCARSPGPYEKTVGVPVSLPPEEIAPTVKSLIRPSTEPDPTDNYRGQQPSDVVILNIVNLSKLL